MSLTDLHIDQSAFNDAYSRADASLRVRQSKLYLILTLVLVPAYVGLDYVVYPSLWHQIFIGRLLCDVAQLPCLALLYTQWGKRQVVLLSKYPPLAPCITICWMIYASEGVISPYYAGINLVLVGVCWSVIRSPACSTKSHRRWVTFNRSRRFTGSAAS